MTYDTKCSNPTDIKTMCPPGYYIDGLIGKNRGAHCVFLTTCMCVYIHIYIYIDILIYMYIYIDIFKNVLMNVFNKYVHKIYIYINELTRPEIQCITLFSRSALISQLYLE